jgi:molybdate transport system substrate-binding protein
VTTRLLVLLTLLASQAPAEELHVMISGGLTAAYNALAPQFERETGHKLVTSYGASMGATPTAIPARLARGEPADVVILARSALDALVQDRRVAKGSEVDLVRSAIGLAVKAGAPVPDISTVEGLKRTLLNARSIAYSDSASGVYVSTELFKRLGIEQVASKARMIPGTPVGEVVARGEAEVGLQQMSELMAVSGIQLAGPLPDAVQRVTIFSAGVSTTSKSPAGARKLIEFLSSSKAWEAIRRSGIEPIR